MQMRVAPMLLWREALGLVVRDERLARGWRIVDLAGRAGISSQYLSEVERGLKDPSSEMLETLAGALDLGVHELASRATAVLADAARTQDLTCLRRGVAGPFGSIHARSSLLVA